MSIEGPFIVQARSTPLNQPVRSDNIDLVYRLTSSKKEIFLYHLTFLKSATAKRPAYIEEWLYEQELAKAPAEFIVVNDITRTFQELIGVNGFIKIIKNYSRISENAQNIRA